MSTFSKESATPKEKTSLKNYDASIASSTSATQSPTPSEHPKQASAKKEVCLNYYNEPHRAPLCTSGKPALQDYDTVVAAAKAAQKMATPFERAKQVVTSFLNFAKLTAEPTEGPTGAPHTPAKNAGAQLRTYQPER